jgi:quercetin dioxygenase-like cupin family protein
VRFVLEAETSGGRATAFECEVPVDAAMPAAHSHDGFEETNYGLAGVTTFTVDGEQRELHPGEVVFIPRGAVHAFENRHGADARFLAVVTPGLLGPEYFHEIAAVLADATGGPPDPAAIGDVMRRHGLTPAARPVASLER